jgi:RNA-directed DNA polymerase
MNLIRPQIVTNLPVQGEVSLPRRLAVKEHLLGPALANLYLHALDLLMQANGVEMVRYADDFVLLCRDRAQAEAALERVPSWMQEHELQLHPDKTRLVEMSQTGGGFAWPAPAGAALRAACGRLSRSARLRGYHFHHGGRRWPRRKSVQKLQAALKPLTQRNPRTSLHELIQPVSAKLRGWFGYFRHSTRTVFRTLDQWVRERLRAILRQRARKRGRSRGYDRPRWPKAYFARHGLFSLYEARLAATQSHR